MFDTASWRGQLPGTIGVISCLGAFGSNDFMQKVLAWCATFLIEGMHTCRPIFRKPLTTCRLHADLRRLQHNSFQ